MYLFEDDRKGKRNASVVCRTYWTPSMSRCLVDLLLEQVKIGNKSGQSLMKRAWDNVLVSFNERFKSGFDRDVLRSHYKSLKKRFNIVNHLLQQNGFSWDDTREMVVAERHLWDAIIKVNYIYIFCTHLINSCLKCSIYDMINTYNLSRNSLKLDHSNLNPCLAIANYVLYLAKKVLVKDAYHIM